MQKQQDPTESIRLDSLIQNDQTVSSNYQRLIANTISSVFNNDNDSKTVATLRDELIGKIRAAIGRLFEDLKFSSLGEPLENGNFYFTKGATENFSYRNLSAGEKSAFDLILDMVVQSKYYPDAVYCIDEPETHMHTKLQEQLRRIQIRETILSHIERERQLFHKGIKVLSLFFIDEVDHYREYDAVYVVDFDTDELIRKAAAALDSKLHVSKIYFKVESGAMEQIKSKDDLLAGASFVREESAQYNTKVSASSNVKYDLVGKLVDETGLTRKAIVKILQSIQKQVFDQFKDNPEEFIIKAADIINDEKATAIIQHITYNALDEHYETDVFTEPTIKGKLGTNAMKAKKHLYDHIVYDSSNEQKFAEQLDTNTDVAVYVKFFDSRTKNHLSI